MGFSTKMIITSMFGGREDPKTPGPTTPFQSPSFCQGSSRPTLARHAPEHRYARWLGLTGSGARASTSRTLLRCPVGPTEHFWRINSSSESFSFGLGVPWECSRNKQFDTSRLPFDRSQGVLSRCCLLSYAAGFPQSLGLWLVANPSPAMENLVHLIASIKDVRTGQSVCALIHSSLRRTPTQTK